jgi:hypothetical protein
VRSQVHRRINQIKNPPPKQITCYQNSMMGSKFSLQKGIYQEKLVDVDTVDITNRIMQSTFYCRREQSFLTLINDKPDAYGPFWVLI